MVAAVAVVAVAVGADDDAVAGIVCVIVAVFVVVAVVAVAAAAVGGDDVDGVDGDVDVCDAAVWEEEVCCGQRSPPSLAPGYFDSPSPPEGNRRLREEKT